MIGGEGAYDDGELLAQSGRDETQHESAKGNPQPEAGGGHAAGKVGAVAHAHHEGDDPAADGDFDADVAEEEEGADPGDAAAVFGEEGAAEDTARAVWGGGLWGGFGVPEDGEAEGELHGGACNLWCC